MLDFKEILRTEMICSIYMYLECYKLSILLAYPCFSCCCMNCNDCTMYTSMCICRPWSTLKMICP